MNNDLRFIIRVLSDFINDRTSQRQIIENSDDFLRLAKEQEIGAVLYYQLKQINDETVTQLSAQYASTFFLFQNRMAELKRINRAFCENKIPYLIFKGTEIADYYKVPALRSMGDSDILVHSEDKERAHSVLSELGFKIVKRDEDEWEYTKSGMEYELHHHLMNSEVGNLQSHRDFMERHWEFAEREGDTYLYHLNRNFHFVYLILHLRKHFINAGVGIRQFMDLAVFSKKGELDWDWIKSELGKTKLLGFAEKCLGLCEAWFDVPSPFSMKLENSFIESNTDKIFKNGVFGFDDESNKDNYLILKINKVGDNSTAKYKRIVKKLFPSYSSLRKTTQYSYIDNKPYLLPFVWIYRLGRSCFRGSIGNDIKYNIKPASIPNEKIKKRNSFLKEWDLL